MYYNTKQSRAQSISLPRKISCLARVRFPFIQNRLRLQSFRQESLYPRYKSDRIKTPSENKLFRIVFKVVKYNVFFAFEITVKRSLYLVEGDTLAISYNMYLTAKADMGPLKAGTTYKIKVTEFNKFANVEGYDEPMVVHLLLTSTTPGV